MIEITTTNKILKTNKHFVNHFLEMKSKNSKNTAIAYKNDILEFFNVNEIEVLTINDFIKVNFINAEEYILELTKKGLSSATINRKISSLSSIYNWLMKFNDNASGKALIMFNPFTNLKEERPVINSKETQFLTKEECEKLLNSFNINDLLQLRNKTIIALALTTALRKSEIINIKIKDVTTSGEYDIIKVIRKGGKNDLVKLQKGVKNLIEQYVLQSGRDFIVNQDDYLFIGHSNRNNISAKLSPNTLNYMIDKVCKDVGITKKICFHSTRHTAITLAIVNGANIHNVKELAGHANISTTNRYIHNINKLKNSATDSILFEAI